MESSPPPAPPALRKNWWGRNWKWFVPTGCLGVLFLFAIFIGAICLLAFSVLKSSDAYNIALSAAQSDPRVIAELGEPVTPGMFPSGNTKVTGPSGEADLAIPVSGPKATGMIYAVATKRAGRWEFSELVLQVADSKKRIPLKIPPP